MKKTKANQNKLLGWLIPSISEAEFVYFVSLFVFGIAAQALSHWEKVRDFFNFEGSNNDIQAQISILAVILLFAFSFSRLAIKAIISNRKVARSDRSRYVLIPPTFLAIFWAIGMLTAPPQQAQSLLATVVSTIILIRFMAMVGVLKFYEHDQTLKKFAEHHFVDYQMTMKETCGAVALGLAGAVVLLFVQDWLAWMIITYGIGQELIGAYRRNSTPTSYA